MRRKRAIAYNSYPMNPAVQYPDNANGSVLTDKGLNYLIDYVGTIKEVVGDKVRHRV